MPSGSIVDARHELLKVEKIILKSCNILHVLCKGEYRNHNQNHNSASPAPLSCVERNAYNLSLIMYHHHGRSSP